MNFWQQTLAEMPAEFLRGDVVALPDRQEPEWWACAPTLVRDAEGTFWMALRMRTANAPLGLRGYEIRIMCSTDGLNFTRALSITREEADVAGFERPCLLIDPSTGLFKLYACCPVDSNWRIIKFADAISPSEFVASSAYPVLEPLPRVAGAPNTPTGYKDPVIIYADGKFHCYTIGILKAERTFHNINDDGETWLPVGDPCEPILPLAGWHNYAVRPASVLPMGLGYLFIYEGSDTQWPDSTYCNATGIGYTLDLHTVADITPDRPLLASPAYGRIPVWRYSHWLWVGDEIWVYAEVESEDGSHCTQRYRLSRDTPALINSNRT
jgi:hypothetical protein